MGLKKTPLRRKTVLKTTSTLKKGKGLAKRSKKFIEGAEERQEFGKAMMELFEIHWRNHPDRKCESCGIQLWGENNTCYHDHAIDQKKGKGRPYALELENLILVCSCCHSLRNAGHPTQRHQTEIDRIRKHFGL
jgi:hypothetical protein